MDPPADKPGAAAAGSDAEAFFFEEKPAEFSPLYLSDPVRATAACNAGDYLLYVGGGSINGAFGGLIRDVHGLEFDTEFHPKKKAVQLGYRELHCRLLAASRERAGEMVAASELPDTEELLRSLRLANSFCMAGQAIGEEEELYRQAVGSGFLDIFEEPDRPLHERNVAMLYVVGPKGEGSASGQGPLLQTDDFLASVEQLGRNAVQLVVNYNTKWWASQQACGSRLPRVEEVRWCLVSGGVYKPPGASKQDVASATLKGMSTVENKPVVTFTYDDDVFRLAYEALKQEEA